MEEEVGIMTSLSDSLSSSISINWDEINKYVVSNVGNSETKISDTVIQSTIAEQNYTIASLKQKVDNLSSEVERLKKDYNDFYNSTYRKISDMVKNMSAEYVNEYIHGIV